MTWWRHQMETFSALLAICAGNSPVPGEFPAQRPVRRSFDVFFHLRLNKQLCKQSWGWWFETLSRPLWRNCNDSLCHYGLAHWEQLSALKIQQTVNVWPTIRHALVMYRVFTMTWHGLVKKACCNNSPVTTRYAIWDAPYNMAQYIRRSCNMMTSSNGNISRITGRLRREFTGHRWIPRTKANDAKFWCFLWLAPE